MLVRGYINRIKWRIISFLLINIIVNGGLLLFLKLNNINIQGRFYLLITIIILLLLFLDNRKGELLSVQILYVITFIIGGSISIFLATIIYNWIDILFKIKINLNNITTVIDDDLQRAIFLIFFEIIILILLGYMIFFGIIKLFKKVISAFKHYEMNSIYTTYKENIKSILALLTIFLVVFGFLPSFISSFDYKEVIGEQIYSSLMFSYNQQILFGFLVAINPYIYLMMKDFNS